MESVAARHTGTPGADAITLRPAAHTRRSTARRTLRSGGRQRVGRRWGGGRRFDCDHGSTGDEEVLLDGTSVVVAGPGYELRAAGFAGSPSMRCGGKRRGDDPRFGRIAAALQLRRWSALGDSAGSFYHRVEGFETVAVEARLPGATMRSFTTAAAMIGSRPLRTRSRWTGRRDGRIRR